MVTINSVSGGKSSAYIAANYPSDIEIFSLVCCDDPKLGHKDKRVMQMVNDKLEKYGYYGEVVGTTEDPLIFETLFALEQYIGREIVWVRGESFDDLIDRKKMIPNKQHRFCTQEMKIRAIYEWVYMNCDLGLREVSGGVKKVYECDNPVAMRVGYRYDEKQRKDRFTTDFEIEVACNNFGYRRKQNSVVQGWRVGDFPLIDDKIISPRVKMFWKDKNVPFALDSNCGNCFWKPWQQLRANYDRRPELRDWTNAQEKKIGHTFHSDYSVKNLMNLAKQESFDFGVSEMYCQEGHCHD